MPHTTKKLPKSVHNYGYTLQNVSLCHTCKWKKILETGSGSTKESGLPSKSNQFLPPLHKILSKSVRNWREAFCTQEMNTHTHRERHTFTHTSHTSAVHNQLLINITSVQSSLFTPGSQSEWVNDWVGFNGTSTKFRSLAPSLTQKAGTESPTVKESRRYINLAKCPGMQQMHQPINEGQIGPWIRTRDVPDFNFQNPTGFSWSLHSQIWSQPEPGQKLEKNYCTDIIVSFLQPKSNNTTSTYCTNKEVDPTPSVKGPKEITEISLQAKSP